MESSEQQRDASGQANSGHSADPRSPQPSLEETYIAKDAAGDTMDETISMKQPESKLAENPNESSSKASQASDKAVKKSQSGNRQKITQLGDFKLIKKLGQGGMGEVYLANQVSLDRRVALKLLSRELAKKEDFIARFTREAKSMAKIHHPNVVQVYAAESDKGHNFVAIEFIDGQSMQDWMKQLGKLSVGDALNVILECAGALKVAHEISLIHRDIKPDNILVTKKGVVKVADFGLAKAIDDEDMSMTQSGTGLGTPLYMPPEQARDAKNVDHRTDIYALGCTLYYFLTGKLPFTGENVLKLIMAKEKGTFTPARQLNKEIPERLDLMIDKMIAKDPKNRYATCDDVIKDLAGLNLDNAALSFIDGAMEVTRRGGGSTTTTVTKPKRAAVAKSSAEDAAQQAAKQTSAGDQHVWFIQQTDAKGKSSVAQMTGAQVKQAIQKGMIDVSAKGKKSAKGELRPLGQFIEFSTLMEKRLVKSKTDQRAAAMKTNMKEMYEDIDKADRRKKRWRWLKNLTSGTLGGVQLIIYLAVLAGIGFLLYQYVPVVFDMVAKKFKLS